MKWRWLLVSLPAGLGLLIFVVLAFGLVSNPVVYLRIDIGSLVLISSLVLSICMVFGLMLREWSYRVQRVRIREVQRVSDTERYRFLRRLDHEVKNPLTAIRASAANLAALPGSPAYHDTVTAIEIQAIRLGRLLADLRKLADLENYPLELTPVNIADLIQEAYALIEERPETGDRQIMINFPQAPRSLPSVMGDWDLLFLAIHNLLDNAVKFTLPGNAIEIRAVVDGAMVVCEIADTGPGIPEHELPHVWEELARGYSARGVSGSGLGLSLVRVIVERHGGQISLQSRAGHGTVFSLRLPIA